MIIVDPRQGSKLYVPLLRALGAPVDDTIVLDSGDCAFYGSGRAIGIELKKLEDMLQCITTGRFSGHQLIGLGLDYDDYWLIIEGLWRPAPLDGVLEKWGFDVRRKKMGWIPAGHGKRKLMFREFEAFLTTIEVKGGIRYKRAVSPDETARMVYGLYDWYQDYDGHKSHLAISRAGRDEAMFVRPTFPSDVAGRLPGIGVDRRPGVLAAFPTVRKMMHATEKQWMEIDGIGKKIAKGIVEAWDSTA